jgi:hypothetical protein
VFSAVNWWAARGASYFVPPHLLGVELGFSFALSFFVLLGRARFCSLSGLRT